MTASGPTLVVEQLVKDYPTPEGVLSILRGIDLIMDRGDALAITGPSGSGKSTLLYILGGSTRQRPGKSLWPGSSRSN